MVVTTSLWALVFLGPVMAPDVPATLIAGGRYLVYGVAAAIAWWRLAPRGGPVPWEKAFRYGLTGYVGFYLLLTIAVRVSGPTIAVVVLGMSPVAYALLGADGPAERRRLVPPLALVVIGVLLTQVSSVGVGGLSLGAALGGTLLTLLATGLWLTYGLDNARLLARRPDLDPTRWTAAVGVATGLLSLPIVAYGLASVPDAGAVLDTRAVGVILMLGLGPALGGSIGWNVASRRLRPSVAGQFIVLEPVFSLTYTALWLGAAPTGLALVGQATLIAGALWGLARAARGS